MKSTLLKQAASNKKERKNGIVIPIVFAIIFVVSIILMVVCPNAISTIKADIRYLINPSLYADTIKMYESMNTMAIILLVISIIVIALGVVSFIFLKRASISVYDDHVEGYAGKHWNGWCFGTKHTSLTYSEIASIEDPKPKAFMDRYVILVTRGGAKYTFAVEDCTEIKKLIASRLGTK